MAVNNIYYVDMEKRYLDYQNGAIDMRNLHPMVSVSYTHLTLPTILLV